MSYIDTHCHLNFSQFHKDLEAVIEETSAAGVDKLINVGTDLKTSRESLNLASRYNHIYATAGVHPHDAKTLNADNIKQLELLAKDKRIVALGEMGLDYYRNLSSKEYQKQALIMQLELALKTEKPVVIHCRDAYRDILNILDEHYLPHITDGPPGVIHSFSAGPNYLREFLRRGFYIGFNGMITYSGNESLQASVRDVPNDKLLIETDAPYLPPQDYRGQRNEPKLVIEVAKKIAKIKNLQLDEIAQLTTNNAITLFKLN